MFGKGLQRITIAQYDAMLAAQNGVCAICKAPETRMEFKTGNVTALAVDHCHSTKKVRGLLCSRCNKTIGAIADSIDLLRSMEAYLQRHIDGQGKDQTQ